MKICSVCCEPKDEAEFYFKNRARGRLHAQCKICYANKRLKFMKEHYLKYGDDYRARARARKTAIKRLRQEQIVAYLKDKSCESCGFNDIRTLDFDHIDPATKRFGIARALNNCYSWEEILAEIKKCRILCANCHRIRTAEQFGWRKWHLGGVVTQSSAKARTPVQFR
jgi:hypothetical protein